MNAYLGNAFSLQMVASFPAKIQVNEVSMSEATRQGVSSVVGHQDTANVLGVACNRVNISLKKGDVLYVAQLQGGRLPEGSTTLPEGFTFKFLKVELL